MIGSAVIEFRYEPLSAAGLGADVGRVHLSYDTANVSGPATLIAKFPSSSAAVRDSLQANGFYAREVQFYQTLGADAGIPTPRCYAALSDADTQGFVLLLEDMKDCREAQGYVPNLAIADVELVVRELAKFHARHWNIPAYAGMPSCTAMHSDRERSVRATIILRNAVGAVAARYKGEGAKLLVDMARRWLVVWDDWYSVDTGDLTLCHNDLHGKQIFFPQDGSGRFAVFDWQTVLIGSGTIDLARIIMTSLPIEERRAHEKRLCGIYYDELVAHGVVHYSRSRFERRYRQGIVWNLTQTLVGGMLLSPERVAAAKLPAEVVESMLFDRMVAQIEDNDVQGMLRDDYDWKRLESLRPGYGQVGAVPSP